MRFDVFSKRNNALPDVFQYGTIPAKLRQQILWIWKDTIRVYDDLDLYSRESDNPLLAQVQRIVCTEAGRPFFMPQNHSAIEDIYAFFQTSDETLVLLDIIECSFRLLKVFVAHENGNGQVDQETFQDAIETLNHRFRENGVGFEFNADNLEIIRVDNMAIHQSAIQPALKILTASGYEHANAELLEAFDDYKKGDHDDCLVKCCTAMESVLKVIHHSNNWAYNQTDTAASLIRSYILNSGLPSFFQDPLTIIATLRNKLSTAHGQGTQPKNVSEHLARYALNATTSAIILLHEHAK